MQALTAAITDVVSEILRTGNQAPKVYIRVRPDGTVDVSEEISWCCSPDEHYKRVPHTLSLEVPRGTRDYSMLSDVEIEECADNAQESAAEIVEAWSRDITAWIEAGDYAAQESTPA